MKKITMLFAALVAAFSLSAKTVTFTPDVFDAMESAAAFSATQDGVKLAISSGIVAAETEKFPAQFRCYKSAVMTISVEEGAIQKIELTATANGSEQYGPGNFTTNIGFYTFESDGANGVWEGSAASVALTAAGAQVRMTQVVVTYDPTADPTDKPVEPKEPIAVDVAGALAVLAENDAPEDTYVVTGYITEVVEYAASYGNETFWLADSKDGGQQLKAYRIATKQEAYVGAKVAVTGSLVNYGENKDPQIAQAGSSMVIIEQGEEPEAQTITVAQAIEMAQAGATGKVNIEGYVLSTYNNGEYSEQYNNQSFYMGDTANDEPVFVAYRVKGDGINYTIPAGTKVRIEGATLTTFKNTPETAQGATVVILNETGIENAFVAPAGLDVTAPMFNILGTQVDETFKGIVIQNGKKYLLK